MTKENREGDVQSGNARGFGENAKSGRVEDLRSHANKIVIESRRSCAQRERRGMRNKPAGSKQTQNDQRWTNSTGSAQSL